MKFETVWNHFVRDVFGTLSSKSFAAIATWRYSKTRQTTYYGTLLRPTCKQYWFSFCIVIVVIQCPTLLRYYGLLVLNIYFGLYSKTCDTLYCVTTLLQPSCKEYLDFCVFMVIVVIQITTLLRWYGLLVLKIYFGLDSKTCDTVYHATMLLRYYGLVVKNIDFCFFFYGNSRHTVYYATTLVQPPCT